MTRQAIILAGGKGERLRPYTEDRPKAMIPILGTPLLTFSLRLLSSYDFKKIVICCGYKHQILSGYFGCGSQFDVEIEYLVETEPLGSGGALRQALEFIQPKEPVLAMNGDLLTNINLHELITFHKQQNSMATIVAVPMRSPYGIVEITNETIVSGFKEKPELPFWINAGIYILSPEIINRMPEKGNHEELVFPQLARENELRVYKTKAFWKTIDTVKDLTDKYKEIEQFIFEPVLPSLVDSKSGSSPQIERIL